VKVIFNPIFVILLMKKKNRELISLLLQEETEEEKKKTSATNTWDVRGFLFVIFWFLCFVWDFDEV